MRIRTTKNLMWWAAGTATLLLTACGGHSKSHSSAGSTAASVSTATTGGGGAAVVPALSVSSGPESQGLISSRAPAAGLVVGQLRFTANADVTLIDLALTADGTVDEATGLGDVVLYHDVNGDGSRDAGDLQLGTGQGFSSNNGTVTFTGLGAAVTAATPLDVLVTFELTAPNIGDTVSFRAEGWRMSAVETGTTTPVVVDGGGITGSLLTIGTDPPKTIDVSTTPSGPSGITSVAADATNVPVLAINLTTTTGDIDVKGLTFWTTGTGDDHTDILSARLGRDANNNGVIDAGETVLGTSRVDRNDGSVTFNFWGQRLFAGTGYDLVLDVSLAGTALSGETFAFALKPAGVLAHNYYGNGGTSLTLGASPLVGAMLQVNAGSSSLVAEARGVPASIATGGTETLAMALDLRTGSGPVDVTSLQVRARGSIDDVSDVSGVSVYLDSDQDGAFSASGDTLIAGPLTFSANDGALTFAPASPQTLVGQSATTILVTATLSATAAAGQTFELSLDPQTDVTASVAATGGVQHGALLVTGSGNSVVAQPDADLGKDAYLRGEGLYLNDNFGRNGLAVGDRFSGQLGERLFYIEPPLPTIPAGAAPQKAYMALFLSGTSGLNVPSLDVQVFRVIDSGARTPWSEGRGGLDASLDGICYDGTIQATNRPDLAHPDASTTVLDEVNVASGTEGRWVIFDVTAAAQQWYSGASPNFGLRFRDKNFAVHSDGAIGFHSSDSPQAALRPMFLVQY